MTSEIEKESFEQWPFWPTVKSIFSCGNKLFIAREITFISAVEKHHYLFLGWKWPQKWNKCIYLKLPYYQFASCPWCRREGWVTPIITCWVQAMQIHVGSHLASAPRISVLLGPRLKVVPNFTPKKLLPSNQHTSSLLLLANRISCGFLPEVRLAIIIPRTVFHYASCWGFAHICALLESSIISSLHGKTCCQ